MKSDRQVPPMRRYSYSCRAATMPPQISVLGTGPVWNEIENHCSATEPRGVRLYREHRPAIVQGKPLYSRGRAFSFSGAWRSRDHVLARSDSLAVNWN